MGDKQNRAMLLAFVMLHLVCCGLLLLLVFGVTLPFLDESWPIAAFAIALLLIVGFAWYWRRACSACPEEESTDQSRDAANPDRNSSTH